MPRLEDMVRGEKFDPARSQEVFRVAVSDHASIVVLPSQRIGRDGYSLRSWRPPSSSMWLFYPFCLAVFLVPRFPN
jgi:hypothetical protein